MRYPDIVGDPKEIDVAVTDCVLPTGLDVLKHMWFRITMWKRHGRIKYTLPELFSDVTRTLITCYNNRSLETMEPKHIHRYVYW